MREADWVKDVFLLICGGIVTWIIEAYRDKLSRDREKQIAVSQNRYTWDKLYAGADWLGKRVIHDFRPDVVLTFAGPGSIFANLVLMRSLNRKQLLQTPIITGQMALKTAPLDSILVSGTVVLESERFLLVFPDSITAYGRDKKIAIIDDSVTTGSSAAALKASLVRLGFDSDNIKVGCFVAYEGIRTHLETHIDFVYEWNQKFEYEMPWGKMAL